MNATRAAATRPQIHMIEEEADSLSDLALTIEHRSPQVSELLIRETSRAKLYAAANIPRTSLPWAHVSSFWMREQVRSEPSNSFTHRKPTYLRAGFLS